MRKQAIIEEGREVVSVVRRRGRRATRHTSRAKYALCVRCISAKRSRPKRSRTAHMKGTGSRNRGGLWAVQRLLTTTCFRERAQKPDGIALLRGVCQDRHDAVIRKDASLKLGVLVVAACQVGSHFRGEAGALKMRNRASWYKSKRTTIIPPGRMS